MIKDNQYNEYDREAAKILDDFLPEELFDAHAHLFSRSFMPEMSAGGSCFSYRETADVPAYLEDMAPLIGKRKVRLNIISGPDGSMLKNENHELEQSVAFLKDELDHYPENVGEVMVRPCDTPEAIYERLVHPRIRGLKCYHLLSGKSPSWECGIGEYLPEAAWEAANERGLAITLHMVKDRALADPDNLAYIIDHAKRYPNAILILAHAARSFASWTAIDSVDALIPYENVWFDFAAVCESPAMFYIMRKCGISRCMWGSDYPVSLLAGKAISIADTFYWVNAEDLNRFGSKTTLHSWLVGTETFMAVRQALKLYGASEEEKDGLFCHNAERCFRIGV